MATGSTDTLSDVLRAVRLRGAVFYAVSVGPEWAVEAPASAEVAAMVVPGAGHWVAYEAPDAFAAILRGLLAPSSAENRTHEPA